MTPALSIITVTYNDPEGLRQTFASLRGLAKLSLSWEHVVVDSSPGKNQAVLEAEGSLPLVHVTPPPSGVYAAMNAGLARAQGRVLWFLNGGDRLVDPKTLLELLDHMERQPKLDLLCAGVDFYRDGKFLYPRWPRKTLLQGILGRDRIPHQGLLYRRSSFERVGEFSTRYRIAGDYEHHFRCYLKGLSFETAHCVLAACDASGRSFADWRLSLKEASRLADDLQREFPTWLWMAHKCLARVEYLRVWMIKQVNASPAARLLRPLWLAWNRRRPMN